MLPVVNYDNLFSYFCQRQEFEKACHLIDLYPFELKSVLHTCSVNGYVEVVYHIVTLYPFVKLYPHTFEETCMRNEMAVAKCLYRYKTTFLSRSGTKLKIINRLCVESDHIGMIEWLVSITSSVELKDLFYTSCQNPTSLEIAKYIYRVSSINILDQNHFLFQCAVRDQFVLLAQWIVSLRPDVYSIVIHKNKIVSSHIAKCYKLIYCCGTTYVSHTETCSICYEPANIISNCQHLFCDVCIYNWSQTSCPYCRQKVQSFSHLEQQKV